MPRSKVMQSDLNPVQRSDLLHRPYHRTAPRPFKVKEKDCTCSFAWANMSLKLEQCTLPSSGTLSMPDSEILFLYCGLCTSCDSASVLVFWSFQCISSLDTPDAVLVDLLLSDVSLQSTRSWSFCATWLPLLWIIAWDDLLFLWSPPIVGCHSGDDEDDDDDDDELLLVSLLSAKSHVYLTFSSFMNHHTVFRTASTRGWVRKQIRIESKMQFVNVCVHCIKMQFLNICVHCIFV